MVFSVCFFQDSKIVICCGEYVSGDLARVRGASADRGPLFWTNSQLLLATLATLYLPPGRQ